MANCLFECCARETRLNASSQSHVTFRAKTDKLSTTLRYCQLAMTCQTYLMFNISVSPVRW